MSIAKKKMMMRKKQMMKRKLCRLSIATIVTSILAAIVVPIMVNYRGHAAAGGEWLLLFAVFIFVYKT